MGYEKEFDFQEFVWSLLEEQNKMMAEQAKIMRATDGLLQATREVAESCKVINEMLEKQKK